MSGRISPQRSLEQLKKEAKRWLKALRAGARDARDRFDAALPGFTRTPTLRDVQHALARELGFTGWTALKEAALEPSTAAPSDALVARFLDNACPDHHVRSGSDHLRARSTAMRLLERYPEIAAASLATRVVCGDVAGVREILAADPTAADRAVGTPSGRRAGPGNAGDLLRRDWGKKGWTPLLYRTFTRLPLDASNDNALEITRLLLDAGAHANAYFMAGDSRYTPLVGVIGEGEEQRPAHPHRDALVRLLIDRGAEPFDMQVIYDIHFRADVLWFMEMIYSRSVELGRAAAWEDPSWAMLDTGGYGNGARWHLEMAIAHGDVALAEWCLAHGADPDAPPARDTRFPRGSLYEVAVRAGCVEIADLLRTHGAPPREVSRTPAERLLDAALRLDRRAVDELLASHPELRQAPAPLFHAAGRDRTDALSLLLDAGIPINLTDDQNETALHQAVFHGAAHAAKLLIDLGADVDVVGTRYDNTPLGTAVWGRNQLMIDLLAPRSRDVWNLVYAGKLERIRELLTEIPDRARASGGGHTLLMWLPPDDEDLAIEIATLLLAHGADPRPRNNEGMTAADLADRIGMSRLEAFLRAETTKFGPDVEVTIH